MYTPEAAADMRASTSPVMPEASLASAAAAAAAAGCVGVAGNGAREPAAAEACVAAAGFFDERWQPKSTN